MVDQTMPSSSSEARLLEEVNSKLGTGQVTHTSLETDSRVLARITDGIYRSPAAALRELVTNAYDADATLVTIETSPPWFNRVVVRDDGAGMDPDALVRLLKHIGGSTKRTSFGPVTGTTGPDPNYSPRGRRLIGRIGIGLFSVSQMTRHFQIVTKRAGSSVRLVADVLLDVYSEDRFSDESWSPNAALASGEVRIQTFEASDLESHGTDIVLLDLKREAQAYLRSEEDRVVERSFAFHSGVVGPSDSVDYGTKPVLPWDDRDPPREKFEKLFEAVLARSGREKAKLESILDRYMQVMWQLALSVPLDYLDGLHPFDLDANFGCRVFQLSNATKGQAVELVLGDGETIRQRLALKAPERGELPFRVVMDGVELRRPLRICSADPNTRPQDQPLLFVGSWSPSLTEFPETTSGGRELSFEAYLLWTPRVTPAEHAGILVRIADASGILFDETFMDYSIAELSRLKQTSGELFVHRGLDAALNIDRESFNGGHPHAKLVRHWVHQAMRQLATTQKRLSGEIRSQLHAAAATKDARARKTLVQSKLAAVGATESAEVRLTDSKKELVAERQRGTLAYDAKEVLARLPEVGTKARRKEIAKRKDIMASVAALLDGYGAFEDMTFARQQELLNGIARIFWGSSDGQG
jgi:hypothetical protein